MAGAAHQNDCNGVLVSYVLEASGTWPPTRSLLHPDPCLDCVTDTGPWRPFNSNAKRRTYTHTQFGCAVILLDIWPAMQQQNRMQQHAASDGLSCATALPECGATSCVAAECVASECTAAECTAIVCDCLPSLSVRSWCLPVLVSAVTLGRLVLPLLVQGQSCLQHSRKRHY